MKVTMRRDDLLSAISQVKPCLKQYYAMTKAKGKVSVYSSNGDVALILAVRARATGRGTILMPPSVVDFLRAVNTPDVTLSSATVDGRLMTKLTAGSSSQAYPVDPDLMMPILPESMYSRRKPIIINDLGWALEQVAYAIAKDTSHLDSLKTVLLDSDKRGTDRSLHMAEHGREREEMERRSERMTTKRRKTKRAANRKSKTLLMPGELCIGPSIIIAPLAPEEGGSLRGHIKYTLTTRRRDEDWQIELEWIDGGVADLVSKPAGITVEFRDYDNGKEAAEGEYETDEEGHRYVADRYE